MKKGIVKWFNAEKGYGFLEPVGGDSRDVFVHFSKIEAEGYRSLNDGEEVEYEEEEGPKGPSASKVLRAPEFR